MAQKLPHIASDTQHSKLLNFQADSELDMMFWLAETYWNVSLDLQRELAGYLYQRQSDGKIVTTIHKSSFSTGANLSAQNDEDHFKAQHTVRVNFPDHHEDGPYCPKALWHTHIFVKVHKKSNKTILDAAADSNAMHATRVFIDKDASNIEKIRKGYPDFNGYIITPSTIVKYDPKYFLNAREWQWPSREEIPR